MSDVFISYSRRDSQFVADLRLWLRRAGRSPWVDVDGIRPAEDFMAAIRDAIDRAQAFVFVISPDSIVSAVCARELEHAVTARKRLVPVVCRDVDDAAVPLALRGLNWIKLRGTAPQRRVLGSLFASNPLELLVRELLLAVDTDLEWVRMHTRLSWRAAEWDAGGRAGDQLLRGSDLAAVVSMASDSQREPKLSALQLQYIEASQASTPPERQLAHLSGQLGAVSEMHGGGLPIAEDVLARDGRIDLCAVRKQADVIGGDFYDFYRLDDDRLLLLVGDVSGKGMPAAFFMQMVKALFKSAALRGASPLGDVVSAVNRDAMRENPSSMFVAMFVASLDARTGLLTCCNAGGERPLLVAAAEGQPTITLDRAEAPPLGVMEDFDYPADTVQMSPGDTLCVFTDGLVDVQNARGGVFGREALHTLLHSRKGVEMRKLCDHVLDRVEGFRSGAALVDDLTLLALQWRPRRGA